MPKVSPGFVLYRPGSFKEFSIDTIESKMYTIVDTGIADEEDVFDIAPPLLQEYMRKLDEVSGYADFLEMGVAKAMEAIAAGKAARRRLERLGATSSKRNYTALILKMMGSDISIDDLEAYIDSVAARRAEE